MSDPPSPPLLGHARILRAFLRWLLPHTQSSPFCALCGNFYTLKKNNTSETNVAPWCYKWMDGMDGWSLGGVKYRAPYGAKNLHHRHWWNWWEISAMGTSQKNLAMLVQFGVTDSLLSCMSQPDSWHSFCIPPHVTLIPFLWLFLPCCCHLKAWMNRSLPSQHLGLPCTGLKQRLKQGNQGLLGLDRITPNVVSCTISYLYCFFQRLLKTGFSIP